MSNGVKRYASEDQLPKNLSDLQNDLPQVDWNENDEASKTHVLNRTHYFTPIDSGFSMRLENASSGISLVRDCTDMWNSSNNSIKSNFSAEKIVKRRGQYRNNNAYGSLLAIRWRLLQGNNYYDDLVYDSITHSSLITKIDDVNFCFGGNQLIYIIYDLTTLTDEYKNSFPVEGVYFQPDVHFDGDVDGIEVEFGNYISINDHYIPENILRVNQMDLSEDKKQIARTNIDAASVESVDALGVAINAKQDKNLIVNITSTTAEDGTVTYSADKTFDEIIEAYNNGTNIYAKKDSQGGLYNLTNASSSIIQFELYTERQMYYYDIMLLVTNKVFCYENLVMAGPDAIGGVFADDATDTDTVPVRIKDDGKLYVPTYPNLDGKLDASTFAEHLTSTELFLSSPNGTKFQITIGDDGVLSATEITE